MGKEAANVSTEDPLCGNAGGPRGIGAGANASQPASQPDIVSTVVAGTTTEVGPQAWSR